MQKGFSLIELLIVLVLAGILACVAYPNYQHSLTRARRADGQSALLHLAVQMERYYFLNNTYGTATIGQNKQTDVYPAVSPQGWYRLMIEDATDTTYLLKATPIKGQAASDGNCPWLTLNHQGIKNGLTDCW